MFNKTICSLSNKKQLRFLKFLRNLNLLEIEHVQKLVSFCEKEGEKEVEKTYNDMLNQFRKQAKKLNEEIEFLTSQLN